MKRLRALTGTSRLLISVAATASCFAFSGSQPAYTQTNFRDIRWSAYHDKATGASIEYPSSVLSETHAESGRTALKSRDQRASLIIYSRPSMNARPQEFMERQFSFHGLSIDYHRVTDEFFVVSGTRAIMVHYIRCNLERSIYACFELSYPKKETKQWDAIVARISRSLKVEGDAGITNSSRKHGRDDHNKHELVQRLMQTVPDMKLSGSVNTRVPLIPCQTSGMTGDEAPPQLPSSTTLMLPPHTAAKVSLYKSSTGAILGPKAWTCKGSFGSSGSSLTLAPTGEGLRDDNDYRGPLIIRYLAIGETSGRFTVASIAALLFPALENFVESVRSEGIAEISTARPPADTYYYLTPSVVAFRTKPKSVGLARAIELKPSNYADHGLVHLYNKKDSISIAVLVVRLDARHTDLIPAILATEMLQ